MYIQLYNCTCCTIPSYFKINNNVSMQSTEINCGDCLGGAWFGGGRVIRFLIPTTVRCLDDITLTEVLELRHFYIIKYTHVLRKFIIAQILHDFPTASWYEAAVNCAQTRIVADSLIFQLFSESISFRSEENGTDNPQINRNTIISLL